MNDLGVIFAVLDILFPLLIYLLAEKDIKSLKMTVGEVKRMALFFLVSFVLLYVFIIIILGLSSILNLYNLLIMVTLDFAIILYAGLAVYLPHVVDPRLKRDYEITTHYIRRQGLWKSLDEFEEYKK
jgi:hypothetical protein